MEADTLRLILIIAGVALVLGIYAADRYKRSHRNGPTNDWTGEEQHQPQAEHVEPSWDADDEDMGNDAAADEQNPELEDAGATAEPGFDDEFETLEHIIHEDPDHLAAEQKDNTRHGEQIAFSFLTGEATAESQLRNQDPDLPVKIVQLNIVPHEGLFYGDDILCVIHEVGLEYGEMGIYHYYDEEADDPQVLFSMANMVEPGTFPLDDMDEFSTPGLTIFTRLPGPRDGLSIFSDMLYTAEQLATILDGELRDEAHSALSKQTIGHIREEIQEHHRQLQLVRSSR